MVEEPQARLEINRNQILLRYFSIQENSRIRNHFGEKRNKTFEFYINRLKAENTFEWSTVNKPGLVK